MKHDWLVRTEAIIGIDSLNNIRNSKISIIGLGGVGSYAAEAIARAGVNHLQLIDYDTVSINNINRQLLALHSTIGQKKTEVMKKRILDINPEAEVNLFSDFFCKANRLDVLKKSDYIIDAIDSLGPKMGMIKDLCGLNLPFISVLAAGNRINQESIKISSIWNTEGCPFAKRLKKLLRRNNITQDFPVVYSDEVPIPPLKSNYIEQNKSSLDTPIPKSLVGSISYMPAIMGLMAAGFIIQLIINTHFIEKNKINKE